MTTTAERYHHVRKQNYSGRLNTAKQKHNCKELYVLAQVIHAVQAGYKLYAISFHDASCTLRSLIFADYSTDTKTRKSKLRISGNKAQLQNVACPQRTEDSIQYPYNLHSQHRRERASYAQERPGANKSRTAGLVSGF